MRTPVSILRILFALAVPVLLSNCMTDAVQTNSASAVPTATGGIADQPDSTSALASADAPVGDPGSAQYRISPRDILEISVFQVADLNKAVQVSDDGKISLPLIGVVQVKGRTTDEAAKIISDRLGKKYLQSPQVSVFVKTYGQRVTVNGAVNSPRVLPLEGSLTLSQAVAYAGGFTELGDPKRIHVARVSNGHVQDNLYNLDDVQAGTAQDPYLQGGDIVVVEKSGVQVALKNLKDLLPFAIFASIF